MTQNDQILAYMKRYGSINPYLALSEFGCFRLASRIHDLRSMGYDIETINVTRKLPNGSKTWAEYKLKSRSPVYQTEERQNENMGATPASQISTNV